MNHQEAKLILGSIHPGTGYADDRDVSQAIALLDRHPDLRCWFDAELAFDGAVAAKLSEIHPPEGLKATLVNLLGDGPQAKLPQTRRTPSWLRPPFLAAAAAIILIPIIALPLLTGRANAKSFESFRSDMVEVAKSPFVLKFKDPDLPNLFTWLNDNQATCPSELPACVANSGSVGCTVVDWGEEKVTLICLKNDGDQTVHCFIVPRAEFGSLPEEAQIRKNHTVADLDTSGWSDTKHVYLLVGSEPGVPVKSPSN